MISLTRASLLKQSGIFAVLAPVILLMMLGVAAFAVDAGFLRVANAQLQTTTDAAALAGVTALSGNNSQGNNSSKVDSTARDILGRNNVLDNLPISNINVQTGVWDNKNQSFTPTATSPNAVKVTADTTPPLFFSKYFEKESSTTTKSTASSIAAVVQTPLAVMFVVDAGQQMNYYSGSNVYLVAPISVASQHPLAQIEIIYQNLDWPSYRSSDDLPIAGSKFKWVNPLSYSSNTSNATIKKNLGIENAAGTVLIPYPYPKGSWDEYIDYVKTSAVLKLANNQNTYGYYSLVSYFLDMRSKGDETTGLWKTQERPWSSVGTSIHTFLKTNLTNTEDMDGLVLFNGGNINNAVLERKLSTATKGINAILIGTGIPSSKYANKPGTGTRGRQSAEYSTTSNMVPGLSIAIDELIARSPKNAKKMIFLFSTANFTDTSPGALDIEVQRAKTNGIVIHTIGFQYLGTPSNLQTFISGPTGGNSMIVNFPAEALTDFGTLNGEPADFSDTLKSWLPTATQAEIVQ